MKWGMPLYETLFHLFQNLFHFCFISRRVSHKDAWVPK